MATVVPRLETAVLHAGDLSEVIELLVSIQDLIRKRRYSCFIGHIRAHSSLPGPLAEGNNKADEAIRQVLGAFEEAQASHRYFHQNSLALRKQLGLKREQARQIVSVPPVGTLTMSHCLRGSTHEGCNLDTCGRWTSPIINHLET